MDQGAQQPAGTGRGLDWGAVVFGVLLVVIGAYLVLKDTLKLDIPDISWDMAWPIILIAIGVIVLLRAMTGHSGRRRRFDR